MKPVTRGEGTQLPPELDLDLVALARSGPGPYVIQAELPAPWIAAVLAHTDAENAQTGSVSIEVTPIGRLHASSWGPSIASAAGSSAPWAARSGCGRRPPT